MKDFIKKYEIWIFLILAPIVNTLFVLVRIEGFIPSSLYNHGRFFLLLFLLVCIVKLTRGFEGIRDMFRPMLKWKVKPKWYLFSLVFALTMGALTLLVKGFFTGIDYALLYMLDLEGMTVRFAFIILIWAFLGEVVWVSYSIRELSKITNAFYASQVVGFFWTLWWLPIVHLGEGVIPDFPTIPLFIGMMGTAGMCAVVYGETKSGLAVWLLQFMLNMSLLLLAISPREGGITTYTTFVVIYYITMLSFMYFRKTNKKFEAIKSNG